MNKSATDLSDGPDLDALRRSCGPNIETGERLARFFGCDVSRPHVSRNDGSELNGSKVADDQKLGALLQRA
jgi:hypothetical protein